LAPGGKWADELEATGMVKAEAGRPGPYCLGRLILRHRIDAKRCSIDPTRSRHAASARQRGGDVYDRQQIDRRRRSPKGKKIDPVAILLFGARLPPLSHIETAPPFPPEALSRFVQFRLTTNPSLRGVPKQLHRANVGSVARDADPNGTSSRRRAAPSPRQQTDINLAYWRIPMRRWSPSLS
jgi:hypothetical protein